VGHGWLEMPGISVISHEGNIWNDIP